MRPLAAALAAVITGSSLVGAVPSTATPVPEAPACPMLPADNVWHADISTMPVHTRSNSYISSMGAGEIVHADFGSGEWDGGPIGIPYVSVPGNQPGVAVSFTWPDESDPGPYPIPPNPPIEGGPDSRGDRHILMVDRDNCVLYELYAAYPRSGGTWRAGSGAIFDLNSNDLRPSGWTSADAAGFAILPGLVRYDEVASGFIDHAIRMTADATQDTFIWPARHQAGDHDTNLPPMGLRLRLRDDFDISGFSPRVQVILEALKTYGAIIADNGSSFYISGVPDERWDNDELHELDAVEGSDFEAIDESSLMVHPDSGQAAGGGGGPSLAVGDRTAVEGPNPMKITVSLSAPSTSTVQVRFTTSNGTALAGSDYVALNRIVKIKPGHTHRAVKVTLVDNAVPEATETFTVTLSNPSGATIADASATATITDSD